MVVSLAERKLGLLLWVFVVTMMWCGLQLRRADVPKMPVEVEKEREIQNQLSHMSCR